MNMFLLLSIKIPIVLKQLTVPLWKDLNLLDKLKFN